MILTHKSNSLDQLSILNAGEVFLKALIQLWDDHTASMTKLRDVLKYMDKVYTPTKNVASTWELGLNLFRDVVLNNSETSTDIQFTLFAVIHSQICLERDGQVIDRSALKSCCDILFELSELSPVHLKSKTKSYIPPSPYEKSIYTVLLEPQLRAETEKYYRDEATSFLESNDIPSYLKRVESRLEEESNRCLHYLSHNTSPIFKQVLEKELISNKIDEILSNSATGLVNMIENDSIDILGRLYNLFQLIPEDGPVNLRRAIKHDVIRRGQSINSDIMTLVDDSKSSKQSSASTSEKKPSGGSDASTLSLALQWVRQTLTLKLKMDNLWHTSFKGDLDIQTSINEGFETFINMNPKASEFISLFIDDNLKKGLKGKTEDETDQILDETIILFRFLVDKDVFEVFYKRHLARRLIQGRSVSDDAERGMLAKLKVECGVQFTQKMEDMRTSADNMKSFKTYKNTKEKESENADLNVNVLTASYWPISAQVNTCTLPAEMMRLQQQYERFYLQRHSGRRMLWQVTQGSVDLKVEFQNRKYEINVSTLAAIILLLFENVDDEEWVSYQDIMNATNIAEGELKRNLQTLACGKYKLLEKDPKSKDVKVTDKFRINNNFSSPLAKIKIATIANRVETTEERKQTDEKVEEERKHQTDACIVRIMKSRKQASHNEVIIEATKILGSRFAPTPQAIKKRIEALIEFGSIELVKCKLNGSFYALKIMNKGFSKRNIGFSNPTNEKAVHLLAATRNTSNCLPLVSAFQSPDDLFIQLPLAINGNLLELLEQNTRFETKTIKLYSSQLLNALTWLHDDIGWLHRDIKPQNILLSSNDHILLTDFGAAVPLLNNTRKAKKSDSLGLVGTTDYVSPEILLAAEEYLIAEQTGSSIHYDEKSPGLYGPETDWWSFGVVLFELAYGVTPFFAETVGETYNKIRQRSYTLGQDTNGELRHLLDCLFKPQTERLGYYGTKEVRNHAFFRHTDWESMSKRKIQTTYFDKTLDELVEDDSIAVEQPAPQKAFDFSALFQAADSISLEAFNESFQQSNNWNEFNYIPPVQDLFPSYHTRKTPETPFKLSFNNTTSTHKNRNLSEEQAFIEMQQCVGLSAKKRLDYSFNLDTLPRAVSYSSDLSSVDDNTQNDGGGYRESPLKRVESRSSLSRMNSQQSVHQPSLSRMNSQQSIHHPGLSRMNSQQSIHNPSLSRMNSQQYVKQPARPALRKNFKSSPNMRLDSGPRENSLSTRASSSRLARPSRLNVLDDLPENENNNPTTSTPHAPKNLHSRMDNLKKRHDALLKDLNQTSRRHEKLLARSSSRQSLRQ
ncbi:Cullin-domain-containing protein [Wallemia mellicola]|nr:Cullin-domain-containing protein [Wallemia mellicola]